MEKRNTTRQLGVIARSLFKTIEARREIGGVNVLGISSGFDIVDDFTGGLQPDQFWVLPARTSVGKTAMAMSMALHAGASGVGTLFYSLEMSGEILVNRLLSQITGIAAGRIIRGKYDEVELGLIVKAIEKLDTYKVAIIDKTNTSNDIVEDALRTADKVNVGLIIIDYASILADTNVHGEVTRLELISKNLRNLARPDMLNAPVLVLAQLNRSSEMRDDHRPALSDIHGSDAFAKDADVVLSPFRPYLFERMKGAEPLDCEDDAEIIIMKNRNGPTGSTKAQFYPKLMKWEQRHEKPVEPLPAKRKPLTLAERVRQPR